VALYLPNDNADGFITTTTATDGTAAHIVALLVSENALPSGCALNDFAVTGDKSCRADLNAAYGESLGAGTAAEYLRLGSVVNTLLTFYQLDEITVTIDGNPPETGHERYDYPLRFYENQTADFGGAPETPPSEPPASTDNGDSASDISALPGAIANLPRSDAVDILRQFIGGYWTAADNLFVGFAYQDGIPSVTYGLWDSEGSGFGEFADGKAAGEYGVELTFRFPATEANELYDARPESAATVYIDVSGLDDDGKIKIKIAGHGDSDWYTYAYGGKTAEEAYRSVH
jgi:hypothetical protein